jgi:predicted nucleic acid-binding protein
MKNKFYIDANIILDYCLDRKEKESAKIVLDSISSGDIIGYTSSSIIHILSYVLVHEFGVVKTKEVILSIIEDLEMIDTPKEIVIQSLHSKMNDIEDALQYYTAMHHKVPYFISNDKKLKKESINTLPVFTSSEFVKEFL